MHVYLLLCVFTSRNSSWRSHGFIDGRLLYSKQESALPQLHCRLKITIRPSLQAQTRASHQTSRSTLPLRRLPAITSQSLCLRWASRRSPASCSSSMSGWFQHAAFPSSDTESPTWYPFLLDAALQMMWFGTMIEVLLLCLLVYTPGLNAILGAQPPPPLVWVFPVGVGVVLWIFAESRKWLIRHRPWWTITRILKW